MADLLFALLHSLIDFTLLLLECVVKMLKYVMIQIVLQSHLSKSTQLSGLAVAFYATCWYICMVRYTVHRAVFYVLDEVHGRGWGKFISA